MTDRCLDRGRLQLARLLDRFGRGLRKTAKALGPLEGEPSPDDLRATWEEWVRRIQREVAVLQDHRASWHELQEAAEANAAIPQPNHVLDWIRELYGVVVAIGIRRQADRGDDVVNLARLIDAVARRPELVTRTWFVAKYPTGMEAVAEATFDDLAGPGRPQVDPRSIRNDLAKLGQIAKKVKVYVDQHVAHAAATPTSNVPTYADLVSALDVFDSLVRRYYLMINGSSPVQTTPVKQYPFLRPLAVAWVPND